MSGTSDAVVALLHELRASPGVVNRAKLLREGVQILRRLTAEERRQLALDVAAHAAPDVVPRLNEQLGTDLNPGQMASMLEMLRRLEPAQLEALAQTLQDPQQRGALARDAATATADAAGLWPPPDTEVIEGEVVEEVERPIPPVGDRTPDGWLEQELAEEIERFDPSPAPVGETPDWYRWETTDVDGADLRFDGTPREEGTDAEDVDEVEEWDPTDDPDEGGWIDEDDALEEEPTVVPAEPSARDSETSWFGGTPLGIAPVAPATVPLAERVAERESTWQRLSAVKADMAEFRRLDIAGQLAVLRALPDGWARRRSLEALVRADGVAVADIPRLLATLGRPMDRAWLAATMIEAELLELDQLDAVVEPRAAARLRRRYAERDADLHARS